MEAWNNDGPKPQYRKYLQWIKKHIKEGSPVIICGYMPQSESD